MAQDDVITFGSDTNFKPISFVTTFLDSFS